MSAQNSFTILIVDDEEDVEALIRQALRRRLQDGNLRILFATDGQAALERLRSEPEIDILLTDINMPQMDGLTLIEELSRPEWLQSFPTLRCIVISAYGDMDNIRRAMNLGAYDFLTKPLNLKDLEATLDKVSSDISARRRVIEDRDVARKDLEQALHEVSRLKNQLEEENRYLQEEMDRTLRQRYAGEITTINPIMQGLLQQLTQVAATPTTVLIQGESGTGKELIARAIHQHSPRHARALVKVNCAALPEQLIESELFGHEKGAFTGATARRIGRFELAHQGTIFLDEIGELPAELQAKLLRILQEGELERLGGSKTITVDVRVIAATNRNLTDEVAAGRFREDLFYRLNVFPLQVPPLRERPEDIPILAKHFIARFCDRLGRAHLELQKQDASRLQDYNWPGNVRELENIIERAVILSNAPTLQISDLKPVRKENQVLNSGASTLTAVISNPADPTGDRPRPTLRQAEKHLILAALEDSGWVIKGPRGAAKKLDIAPSTLRDRMKYYGLQRSH